MKLELPILLFILRPSRDSLETPRKLLSLYTNSFEYEFDCPKYCDFLAEEAGTLPAQLGDRVRLAPGGPQTGSLAGPEQVGVVVEIFGEHGSNHAGLCAIAGALGVAQAPMLTLDNRLGEAIDERSLQTQIKVQTLASGTGDTDLVVKEMGKLLPSYSNPSAGGVGKGEPKIHEVVQAEARKDGDAPS